MNRRLGSISITTLLLSIATPVVSGLVLWGFTSLASTASDAKAQVNIVDQREQDHYIDITQRLNRLEDKIDAQNRFFGVQVKK